MADHRFFNPANWNPDPSKSIGSLMGVPVPVNVSHVDVWREPGRILWRTRSGHEHVMDFSADDITPVIVAMRMSC